MMKEKSTKATVMAAAFAGVICITTMFLHVPSALGGFVTAADAFVLCAGWMLSPTYGFLASGIGSALADIISGHVIYAPITFLIKGVMAVIACKTKKEDRVSHYLWGGAVAELVMIAGYYLYEGIIYGFLPSLVNIPSNAVQGCVGIILGVISIKILSKKPF